MIVPAPKPNSCTLIHGAPHQLQHEYITKLDGIRDIFFNGYPNTSLTSKIFSNILFQLILIFSFRSRVGRRQVGECMRSAGSGQERDKARPHQVLQPSAGMQLWKVSSPG